MKKRVIVVLLALAAGGLLAYRYVREKALEDPNAVRVSGNIEVTEAEVSFQIGGRVVERAVDEGQAVKAGDLVARLDERELREQAAQLEAEVNGADFALAELVAGSRPEEIAQAEAAERKAQSALDELLAGSRPQEIAAAKAVADKAQAALDALLAGSRPQEIAAAEATVQRAKADEANLKLDFERQSALFKKAVVASQQLDAAKAAYEAALARLHEAEAQLNLVKEGPRKEDIDQGRAALAGAKQSYELAKIGPRQETIDQARHALAQAKAQADLVRKGPRKETIDQARARVDQARQALAVATTRLGYAKIVSPLDGMVLSKGVEPGEYVAPGTPVVTVGDLVHPWLRAYIDEADLGRVKYGQPVRVTTDSYPGKVYEGRISFISSQAEFTPKTVQTERQRVKLVYRIKIDIDNPRQELKAGMPADAEILVGEAGEENAKSQMPNARESQSKQPR